MEAVKKENERTWKVVKWPIQNGCCRFSVRNAETLQHIAGSWSKTNCKKVALALNEKEKRASMDKPNELSEIWIMAAGYIAACSPDGSDFERGQRAAMITALRWIETLQNSPVSDDLGKGGSPVGESEKKEDQQC